MSINDETPEYLKKLSPLSDDQIWQQISDEFEELLSDLNTLKMETRKQAISTKIGNKEVDSGVYWYDDDVGGEVRSWFQISFDPSRDETLLSEHWETAKLLAKSLRPQIKARRLSLKFARDWGFFCSSAAFVLAEYYRDRPNIQHLKGAEAQKLESQRRWLAHIHVALRQHGDIRREIDGRVLDHISKILDDGNFPNPQFGRNWYEKILNKTHDDFASSFKQNKFPAKKIDELARQSSNDLPPINI